MLNSLSFVFAFFSGWRQVRIKREALPLLVGIQARGCRRAGNGCAKNAGAPRAQRIDEGTDGRVFYDQGNDFNNLSSEDAGALGLLDAIFSSLRMKVSCRDMR
jgi:hypothetical protein